GVPVAGAEIELLGGAAAPAGTSPLGARLEASPARFAAGIGADVPVTVSFRNETGAPFEAVELTLDAPPGWKVERAGVRFDAVTPGASVRSVFVVRATGDAAVGTNSRFRAGYAARQGGVAVGGGNPVYLRAVPAVEARFRPTHDVEGYRAFARETATEWVIETLPTRVPARIGGVTPVRVE